MKFRKLMMLLSVLLSVAGCGGENVSSDGNELTFFQVANILNDSIDKKAYDDFKLPFSIENTNAKITYESSNESIISSTGEIYRTDKIEEVKLTATITYKGETKKYDYNIRLCQRKTN